MMPCPNFIHSLIWHMINHLLPPDLHTIPITTSRHQRRTAKKEKNDPKPPPPPWPSIPHSTISLSDTTPSCSWGTHGNNSRATTCRGAHSGNSGDTAVARPRGRSRRGTLRRAATEEIHQQLQWPSFSEISTPRVTNSGLV
ncbi:hypothetical protein GQ457_12G024490 [Hibiscus cannabinus]